MSKRAKGEGSIFQRKSDGRWVGRVHVGIDTATGKRKTATVYGATEAEVLGKVDALRMKKNQSLNFEKQKDTLTAFLTWWLDNEVKPPNKAGKTYQGYELAVRRYVVPFIGPKKLDKLSGMDISTWMTAMTKKGFTNHMRKRALRTLRIAMNRAIKLKVIDSNPCDAVDMPKVQKRAVCPLEPSECETLFAECQKHRLGDLMILAAMTGLRKGELLALEWSAVNLPECVLVVRQSLQEVTGAFEAKETKSESSRRVVTLGTIAVDALKRRRSKALDEGFDPSEVPLVFPNTVGRLHRNSNFDRRIWHPLREAAGIPDTFHLHDLRHTQASLMLAAGVPMKVVQERLGHSDYTLTANTYSHLLQGAQADAAAKVDQLFESAKS